VKYKLVIADDEPLVLVGLQSMLDWNDFDIVISGLARNGAQLMELIETTSPDLVITDIRMPVKSGLEAMKECGERFGRLPLFIILTSHEEYGYVKEAISYQAVNYLVKIELTRETLAAAVNRAIAMLHEIRRVEPSVSSPGAEMIPFLDRFFVRLLNGLFETREQFIRQMEDIALAVDAPGFSACYCEITGFDFAKSGKDTMLSLYTSILGLLRETLTQKCAVYVVGFDLRCLCVIFCTDQRDLIRESLAHSVTLVKNYFSVTLRCSVGKGVDDLFLIHESYETARMIHSREPLTDLVSLFDDVAGDSLSSPVFDMTKYREALSRSFQELDFSSLADALDRILESLSLSAHAQAMDVACNILYMALSLLPDGDEIVSGIFSESKDGYRSIYECKTTVACCEWIVTLRNGLVGEMQHRKQDYRMRIVSRVQRYIDENVSKKLTLSEVASVHGFSQNYLSALFTKYGGCSFVDYTTNAKITAAKRLMAGGGLMIQEIAELLGFESAFYFSKVFKKVEGIPPREYMQQGE
jgi:two-component system response regulator YesN